MPRTKMTCVECRKEIPARETKQMEAVVQVVNSPSLGEVKLRFCKACAVKHKLGQYKFKSETSVND